MMPDVKHCYITDCYYNRENMCHAEGITIGSPTPKCDTYFKSNQHGGPAPKGHVGACRVADCRWNREMSCNAEGINITLHGNEPDCDTYQKR